MSQVYDALDQLIHAILESETYREYRSCCDNLKEYPDLKRQVDEYRMRNFQLQNSQDYAIDKVEEFEREYANFRENALVNDFLASELALCRRMQELFLRITEALDFE